MPRGYPRLLTSTQIDHAFALLITGAKLETVARLFHFAKTTLWYQLEKDPRFKDNAVFRRVQGRPLLNPRCVDLNKLTSDSEIAIATATSLVSGHINARLYCVLALRERYPEQHIISIGRVLRLMRPHACYYDAKKFQQSPQFDQAVMNAVAKSIGCDIHSPMLVAIHTGGIPEIMAHPKYTSRADGGAMTIKIPVSKSWGIDRIPVSLPYVSILREDYPFV